MAALFDRGVDLLVLVLGDLILRDLLDVDLLVEDVFEFIMIIGTRNLKPTRFVVSSACREERRKNREERAGGKKGTRVLSYLDVLDDGGRVLDR